MAKAGDPPTSSTSPPVQGGEGARGAAPEAQAESAPVTYRFPRQSGSAAGSRSTSSEAVRSGIEVVVAGHLPAQAGAWIDQYAAQLSDRAERGVGLVRLHGGEARVDVFGVDAEVGSAAGSARDAINAAARHVGLWVVSADEPESRGLAARVDVSRVTVLVGANEPAVISAYRVLKALAVERLDCLPREDLPDLRVAVMGVERGEAERVAYTLRETAATFLDEHIELSACLHRLGPTSGRGLFRGACSLTVAEVVSALAAHQAGSHGGPVVVGDRPAVKASGRPSAEADAPAGRPMESDADDPNLASLLSLEPLGISPPDDPGMLVGVNDAGDLHLVARDAPERGVFRLVAALAWAGEHRSLLAAAAAPVELTGKVVGDLVVERARDVLPLVRSGFRLHVVSRVETPAGGVWHTVELN